MVKCLSQASKSAYGFERQNVAKRQFEATQRKEPRTSAFYQLDNLLFSAEESSLSKKQRRRSAILAFLNRQIKFPACKAQNVAR